jgi:hypothetical protein
MPTDRQRIAALEAEVAELRAAKSPPTRKPIEEEGARVLMGPGALGLPTLTFPKAEEYSRLREIVEKSFPHLGFVARSQRFADMDEDEHVSGFRTAFAYLATLERLETLPRADRYASWWIGCAEEWARSVGMRTGIPLRSFTAAVAAHGDILFSGLDNNATFGVRQGGGDRGRRYGDAWRDVLRTGKLLAPVKSGELARAVGA